METGPKPVAFGQALPPLQLGYARTTAFGSIILVYLLITFDYMLTARYVRDNLQAIHSSLSKRKSDYPLDELLGLDEQNKAVKKEIQQLRSERNKGSIEISEARKAGRAVPDSKTDELAGIRKQIAELEEKIVKSGKRLDFLLWNMPNILDESVPYGKGEEENVEVKRVGKTERRKTPSHEEILTKLGLLDLEQAAKVSGARFYYLKGDLALLEQALMRFAIDFLTGKGYLLIAPPLMLKKEYYRGATALGDFEEALYRVGDTTESGSKKGLERLEEELFLVSTAEHPIAAMNADIIFSPKDMPKRYVGVSPCFRREAGSHGKDTKGIFRVHQFYKVEQFVVCRKEDSQKIFEELLSNTEELFTALGIPYRIMNICTGEIGVVAARKYDLEAYMPAQDRYREMASCSDCTEWQAMRLGIKYDEGERKYAHTLNNTAIATERAIVAIVENYVDESGRIRVPKALIPYMNGKEVIG